MVEYLPSYALGTSVANLQSYDALGLPIPKSEVVDYAIYVEVGSGDLVGQGWLTARHRFAALTVAQLAILQAFEGECYVRTLKEDDTYAIYSALLVASPKRAPKVGIVQDYVEEFRKLVAV